ncbi:DUF4181 domain-containing protein [Virgibacillus doumboii]|uniref:DUF4181 domain-containing protein n=1 Tax=Virgibacillus doumboii TaxID=2697503 RepID=UPI0013DF0C5F|nr:DUF4181 domain-containing protein [Virgibacillus doumboii]
MVEPIIWKKLVIALAIFLILSFASDTVMRKWLKVERKKFFSYNHVNDQHKKIDFTIRISSVILLLFGSTYNSLKEPAERIWFLDIWFIILMFIVVSETARAIMEWKYATNRKAYILTLYQLGFIVVFLFLFFTTDFFGLF